MVTKYIHELNIIIEKWRKKQQKRNITPLVGVFFTRCNKPTRLLGENFGSKLKTYQLKSKLLVWLEELDF